MWVKICGITDERIAEQVTALEPDAIGLNFYSDSRRCVSLETARRIAAALPSNVEPVGVFVNHSAEAIRRTCTECGIRIVQLHGDEPPEFAAKLFGYEIIRAFRLGTDGLHTVVTELERYRRLSVNLKGCLIESRVEGSYGGTGHRGPWALLADEWDHARWPSLILAGGLTPDTVAEGITAVHPWGVDVASGVEQSPGRQDLDKVRRFITEARQEHSAA